MMLGTGRHGHCQCAVGGAVLWVCRAADAGPVLTMAVPWCHLSLLVCWLGGTVGFNLEPRIPVIKNGAAESFFGFSVALHQSFETRFDGSETRKDW